MDQELARDAQKGDQRAFESLMIANHSRLFRVTNGILRDPHLAEDATRQAFIDIWQDIRRLRDVSSFEGWSYRASQQTPTISMVFSGSDHPGAVGILVGEGGYEGLVAVFDNNLKNGHLGPSWLHHRW